MKAQAYSLVAVLITLPLLFYISFYMSTTQEVRTLDIERIVSDQLHQMERSVQRDFEKAMEISVKRAVLAATSDVVTNGVNLDDGELRIWELVTNGSLYGNETFIMYNNTIGEWRDKIIALNPSYNLVIDYSDTNISSSTSFNIRLDTRLVTSVSDGLNIARIDKDIDKIIFISIEGTEDPIFPVNTVGYVGRKIVIFPYIFHAIKIETGLGSAGSCSGNITFDPLDPSPAGKILVTTDSTGIAGFEGVVSENAGATSVSCYLLSVPGAVEKVNRTFNTSGYNRLYLDNQTSSIWSLPVYDAIEYGYYSTFNQSGPDMIMRLEGNMSTKDNGIETFVNLPELQSAGIPVDGNKVSIAYIYFSSGSSPGQPVRGLQSWFRIDAANAVRYNLTDLMS